MASYLINVLTMEDGFIPPVLLAGSLAAAVSAFVSGWVADKVGRRRWLLVLAAILTVTPFLAFPMINTTSKVLIAAVIIFGYIFAAQGITAPQMSYFSEQFGSRYRYAGVTLGREFGSVLGGGFAPLIGSGLLALFSNSWVPVAIYMAVMMGISFVATWLSPETRNRDLGVETNAVPGEALVERNGGWHRDT
ncbi:MFS transporter [Parenemella sanctibonifatiensis]|uniref:MFS transporter n=1 Tax=Parenemella sanctibonifatiensis TaxID=2016505 RepID=UPI001E61A264|nr:MFS transporter [Parenemella sanctibonifatiensis]